LDIKCGSGALLSTLIEAKALAHLCKKIANHFDRKLLIVISDMNAPLSKQLGNALEIFEIISLLTNYQPTRLTELSVMLSTLAIKELSPESSFEKIRASVIDTIVSGKALKHFQQFIVNQGGN
jgi:thymidine phosphorylase